MEAAAAGTPTAAYDVPGVSEAVVHGETGLLVPDGDTAKLAEATRSLLATQAEWPARCRRWASRFSWDDTAGQWEAHLRRVASLPRRNGRFPSPEG
jgi:glycosyltransferase involved in cell wall biosynthesis